MRTVTITVRGRVQGVGFRYALQDAAERAGVDGWARNRRDGTVEAVLRGDHEAVATVLRWASAGPSVARVDDVDIVETDDDAASGFEIRPTA